MESRARFENSCKMHIEPPHSPTRWELGLVLGTQEHQKTDQEGQAQRPRGPCIPQGNVAVHLCPGVPSSLPAEGQCSSQSLCSLSLPPHLFPCSLGSLPTPHLMLLFFPSSGKKSPYTMLLSSLHPHSLFLYSLTL